MGQISNAEVSMQSKPGRNFLAKRQAPLITDNTVAGVFITVAGRENQAESGSESGLPGSFFERLIAVIQKVSPIPYWRSPSLIR